MSTRAKEFEDQKQASGLGIKDIALPANNKTKKLVQPWFEPGYSDIEEIIFDKNNLQLLVKFANLDQVELNLDMFNNSREIKTVRLLSGVVVISHSVEGEIEGWNTLTGSKTRELTSKEYHQHLVEEKKGIPVFNCRIFIDQELVAISSDLSVPLSLAQVRESDSNSEQEIKEN